MKITKHGKIYSKKEDKKEQFVCGNCGCEFDAKEDEYYVDLGGGDYSSSVTNITLTANTFHTVIKDYLVCSCPECHKIVKKTRERNFEPGWTYLENVAGTSSNLRGEPSGTVVYDAADASATWSCEDALSETLLLK